jgi:hypothetical protein
MSALKGELLPNGTAKLSMSTAPGNLSALIVDAAGIEKIIGNLGELRAAMKPDVANDRPTGEMARVLFDPRWSTELEMIQGNSLLHVRDDRYGWLHYMLPKHEAKRLAGYLQAQANTPPPTPEADDADKAN